MEINGRTGFFCLIGSPVGHSGSPAMYNYSFQKTEQDYVYLAFDVDLDKTEEAVSALKALGCKGVNVTMPCKTKVAELADELSDAAELIGACNTVVVKDCYGCRGSSYCDPGSGHIGRGKEDLYFQL